MLIPSSMVNARSIAVGVAYAGIGIAGGLFADYATENFMQGNVAYFNDVVNGAGNIALGVGLIGGPIAGLYEAFFSLRAQNPPANPMGGPGANPPQNITNVHIINRGGRNNFRL